MKCEPEEMRIDGREIYIYFPWGGTLEATVGGLGKMVKTQGRVETGTA